MFLKAYARIVNYYGCWKIHKGQLEYEGGYFWVIYVYFYTSYGLPSSGVRLYLSVGDGEGLLYGDRLLIISLCPVSHMLSEHRTHRYVMDACWMNEVQKIEKVHRIWLSSRGALCFCNGQLASERSLSLEHRQTRCNASLKSSASQFTVDFPFFFEVKMLKNFCVWVFCLRVCLCTTCVPVSCRSQKRVLDPLELECQMVVSHHCGCQCSEPQSHLSSPLGLIFRFNFKS